MTSAPIRPRRRNRTVVSAVNRPGTLFQTDEPKPLTETLIPNYVGPQENIELQKFAPLILYGIALAAIGGGIFHATSL